MAKKKKNKSFNPILNNPFKEPTRHYATLLDGSLDYENIMEGRRPFLPNIPAAPVKKGKQQEMFTVSEMPGTYENHVINLIRREVGEWRKEGYPHTTNVSRELLRFWFANPDRTKPLFFAQQEAVETAVWLNEAAGKTNKNPRILKELNKAQGVSRKRKDCNLPRLAFKMATGTGKTVVMAMLILYHYFNRAGYRNDTRFCDNFLVIAPGITIRDRLHVLIPDMQRKGNDAADYYHERALVPRNFERILGGLASRLVIINRHSLERKTYKGNKRSPFDGKAGTDRADALEDYRLMIRRILGKFRKNTRLLVLNDEAHHCYLPKKSSRDKENQRASVWITGIAEISKVYKIGAVYDLSATPYYLMGSGYAPYALFPWVVSDFGLIEAIESGLVKIPFMPETDSTQELDTPVLRNIYEHVKKELPRKKINKKNMPVHPQIPALVVNALDQFYSHYVKYSEEFEKKRKKQTSFLDTPPVFIIVCNNTTVSHEIFRYVAGYEMEEKDGSTRAVNGHLPLFDNFDQYGQPLRKPPTLLIDSEEIDNSDQITPEFKKVFDLEIRQFKADYRVQYPGKSLENISDSDMLREVVNTVGKAGKLGAHIRCVVSVSMLTEGWDTNTVTHIMGLRAFGSQLLCEQVTGRALRRISYLRDTDGKYPPEYAHVIGVPFQFFKGGGSPGQPEPGEVYVVRALEERKEKYEISFPNVMGYRMERENDRIDFDFGEVENFEIDGSKLPAKTKMVTAISDETDILTPEQAAAKRHQTLVYHITRSLISLHFRDADANPMFQYFPRLQEIVRFWLEKRVKCIGDAFVNMLFHFDKREICHHIMKGIKTESGKNERIVPVLNPYGHFGSTEDVQNVTRRKNKPWVTEKSHVNYVIADTGKWEQIAAKSMEEMDEVISYVKNQFLDFAIPYVHKGMKDRLYYPDFIARCKGGSGEVINLIIEVTGMNQDKEDKKWYVEKRWLPAVNSIREQYGFDRWAFIEISGDIRDIKNELWEKIQKEGRI